MRRGMIGTEESTHTNLLTFHVLETLEHVFCERGSHRSRDFIALSEKPRKDVVVLYPVLELFTQPDWFALDDLPGSESLACDDVTIDVAPVAGIRADDEPVRKRVCV